MSWSKREGGEGEGAGGPRGYHHGNLKEALLRAALELIAQKGPAGFTFAEAARWAGVSPAAPYRHFRDRDELLANVALRGFERFELALKRAWDDGRPDALPGGNGLAFDWGLIAGRSWRREWMLSGGLTAEILPEAVRISGAKAVDVSSGVESRPGEKDLDKIRAFLAAARALG